LLIIGVVVVGIVRAVFQHDWDLLPTFFLDLFYVLPAIYLRNVSLRLRHVKAVLRNRSVEDPNAGLPFVKKALLLFPMHRTTVQKPNTNRTAKELLLFQSRIMESVRLAYYGCLTLLLLIGFAIYQWYRERLLSPSAILVVATVLVLFVGGLAESFRADVLARRADALLGASENEAADHAQGDPGQ
jgi:hypothetical protein